MSRRPLPGGARRWRRTILGPAGDEPPETEPERISRVLRCPRCRQSFETMRRFQMSCPECGHNWDEQSIITAGDRVSRLRTNVSEYAVMLFMWGGLLLVFGLGAGLFVFGIYLLSTRVGLLAGLVLTGIVVAVLVSWGATARERREEAARAAWWMRGWRPPNLW